MKRFTIHDDGNTQWVVFGRDKDKYGEVIDTNEYLIITKDGAMLLDPGGIEVFPAILAAVSEVIDLDTIKAYLCSHQDPDIMSSLPLWLGLTPKAEIYIPWLWTGFVSHFGREYAKNFVPLPDEGGSMTLSETRLEFIPAHYCHSSGNMHVFDPQSRIFFSGDLGSALVPDDYPMFVENFEQHTKFMETFHRRWMPSNQAKQKWIERVRRCNPHTLCPQHGAIFQGDDVHKFLDWLEKLEVGQLYKSA